MSNGDDEETPKDGADESAGESEEVTRETLNERLDAVESDLEAAETEADLDEVEAELDAVESDLEAADLPEPDEDDEDAEDPRAELESRLSDLRDELESQRGPYAEDVVEEVESAKAKISDTRWTEQGETEVREAVETFAAAVGEPLQSDFTPVNEGEEVPVLEDVVTVVEGADLDADDDADTIAALLEAAEQLTSDLEDAQEWDDLETREKLMAEGYYDVLGHRKDYPPEWGALKEHERRGNVDMVLLALSELGSDFMEGHCLDTLQRLGRLAATDEAVEAMLQRAGKRDKPAIRILGKMAHEGAVDTFIDYVDADKDPNLQKVTFQALGEIGDERATQPLANKLVMDNDNVRPYAARALGLIGDTRAVEPLADVLKDDENPNVRASAAWALRQIGTEKALEAVADGETDGTFIVDTETEKARRSLDAGATTV